MAGTRPTAPIQRKVDGLAQPPKSITKRDLMVRQVAARLYVQGVKRGQIARMMVDYLSPRKAFPDGTPRPIDQRVANARNKLKEWEHKDWFRDMVWAEAVVMVDMDSPAILAGLTKKAKRGRVDAARLLFELSGRHNPKGDQTPTQIAVVIQGMPRPQMVQSQAVGAEAIELTAIDEDEDEL